MTTRTLVETGFNAVVADLTVEDQHETIAATTLLSATAILPNTTSRQQFEVT
jgi:hypothetical protein